MIKRTNFVIKVIKKRGVVSLYLNLIVIITLFSLFDVCMENFLLLKKLLFMIDEKKLIAFLIIKKKLLYTVIGTVMGGLVCSFKGIHTYKDDIWEEEMAVSYYLGPWITILLGIAFYCIFSESFISINIGDKNLFSSSTSSLGIGFIVGISWFRVVTKIIKVGDNLFSGDNNKQNTVPKEEEVLPK